MHGIIPVVVILWGDLHKIHDSGRCGVMNTKSITKLTDNELVKKLEKLGGTERELLVKMLGYLIEVERRELYLPRGYRSLYEFCTGHLKYSGASASRRIAAARCMKKYPRIAGMLLRGEINLSVLNLVADMLTKENCRDILSGIKGRSYRDVRRLVARYNPEEEIRDRVKPVYIKTELEIVSEGDPDTKKGGEKCSSDVGRAGSLESTGYGGIFNDSVQGGQREVVFEEKYELRFAVDPEFMEKIERLRALVSNRCKKKPDFETLFELAIDYYLDRHSPEGRIRRKERRAEARERRAEARERRAVDRSEKAKNSSKKSLSEAAIRSEKRGSHKKSRAKKKNTSNSKQSRYIPQSVRDEVYTRDGGRCTYVGTNGKRCPEDNYLQVDHIVPFARGGKNTVNNLRLLCPRHNMFVAEKEYGKKHMMQFRRRG